MSLVSNFIGGISGINQIGSVTSNLDLNDTTFSDLLDKQMEIKNKETNGIFGQLGMPAGMEIEGIDFSEKAADQIEAIGEKTEPNFSEMLDTNHDGEVTTSEAVTFFSSLLDNNTEGQNARSELFEFARKQAANFYHKYSGSVVTDLQEFVDDIHKIIN